MILEGGSQERDNVWWMEKYNKPKIADFLSTTLLSSLNNHEYCIISPHPSITIIKKKNNILL
jgi:hypothetical protein